MGNGNKALVNWLFAAATAMLEDAAELAAAGQSSRLSPTQLAETGQRLQAAARDIAVLAEAAAIVAGGGVNRRRHSGKSRR